mgnify:CR=1 FL=1
MKKALILINAYSVLPSYLNQANRLAQEFKKLGVEAEIRRNDLGLYIKDGSIAGYTGGYDFCVFLDKDKYTAAMLEAAGLRLFNRRSAVEICDDKMLTHLALAGKGIPMPDTVAGALCYTQDAALSDETVRKLENSLGYPMIIKQSYGSLGKGIYRVENRKELKNVYEGIKLAPHLFQRSIEESYGRDVRVIVVGRKCVAAMERRSDGDFRSNLELGGKGFPYKTNVKLNDICRRTAEILNLDYCGIDLLKGREGYLVCEVNSNAFFGGIEKVTGIDVAKIYAEYIYGEIY